MMNEELAASNEDSSFPCEAGILHSSLNCHISEPRGGLQSQTGDGAARALRGLPAAVPSAGEGLIFMHQNFVDMQDEEM